jgi:hypothetical protein
MIKKLIFGLIWFLLIFMVSYLATGVIVLFHIADIRSNQAIYEAAQAFRNTYIIFFAIGALILSLIGTVAGILPGTEKKPRAKKRLSVEKKARKKK